MIFVTVGTQLAFDRLIKAVDEWAGKHRDEEVFAQIGPTDFRPQHLEYADFLSPQRARQLMQEADVIVGHAGMGTILTALQYRKPLIMVPRKADLGEHRNDHQMATAKWFERTPGILVAWNEVELASRLDDRRSIVLGEGLSEVCQGPLVGRLRDFIDH